MTKQLSKLPKEEIDNMIYQGLNKPVWAYCISRKEWLPAWERREGNRQIGFDLEVESSEMFGSFHRHKPDRNPLLNGTDKPTYHPEGM